MGRRSGAASKSELEGVPGIGPSLAEDFRELGFRTVADLGRGDPEAMYESLRTLRGGTMDRCVLYAFRCAVYFASGGRHDPEMLKWWNGKGDRRVTEADPR